MPTRIRKLGNLLCCVYMILQWNEVYTNMSTAGYLLTYSLKALYKYFQVTKKLELLALAFSCFCINFKNLTAFGDCKILSYIYTMATQCYNKSWPLYLPAYQILNNKCMHNWFGISCIQVNTTTEHF